MKFNSECRHSVTDIISFKDVTYISWEEGVVDKDRVKPVTGDPSIQYEPGAVVEMVLRVVFSHPDNDIYFARETAYDFYSRYREYVRGTEGSESYIELGRYELECEYAQQ